MAQSLTDIAHGTQNNIGIGGFSRKMLPPTQMKFGQVWDAIQRHGSEGTQNAGQEAQFVLNWLVLNE
jgi:hypothetical protein